MFIEGYAPEIVAIIRKVRLVAVYDALRFELGNRRQRLAMVRRMIG